ncbi:MAG: NYN domain-containing protein, partial [Ktedonobacteraceae bacterium]|nr:NYN domain-containing protein [Ktedonobacteraceae bacterium]
MTTQNTHHEHSDAEASVVEHQPAPENTVAPSTSETVPPDEAEIQTGIPASDEPATPAEPQAEVSQETPSLSEAPTAQVEAQHGTPELKDQSQNASSSETPTDGAAMPEDNSSNAPEATPVILTGDEASQPETKEDEIRPFTDFMEEFRQAEEARLNASRQEIQTESFEILNSTATPFFKDAVIVQDETLLPAPSNETVADETVTAHSKEEITPLAQQPVVEEPAKETSAPPPAPERAVSPLLRPATRLRVPRHGNRHLREERVAEKVEPAATPSTTPEPAASEAPATAQTEQVPSTDVSGEPEQPRPARRYRFDRPSSTTNVSTGLTGATPAQPQATALQRTEENKEKDVPGHAQTEPPHNGNEQQAEVAGTTTKPSANNAKTESVPAATSVVEQPAQKQPQEQRLPESAHTPSTNERTRRRQGQERQKEQPVATSIPDAVSSVIESAPQSGEVAPEDLPPLEYSELQKASTRRRRRHRGSSSSSNGSTAAATDTTAQSSAQPASTTPPVTPIVPAESVVPVMPHPAPGTNGSQYTIVSGYTVGQMNQGNETTGPFMGPEPSPARGSVVTRDGRTARAEAQRSPIYPPARTHESGPSSASLNHFASTISQAIQTQTDRMVAELRRNSQAPTNVSVSLPPFPSTERVGVFVDVANLLYSARTLRIAVDFGRLLDFLRGNRRLVRAHAYCPTSPQAGDEQMFLQAVKG